MRRFLVLLVTASIVLVACGGGDDGDDASGGGDDAADTALFYTDFEQVCGGGTISGAAEYTDGPGIHPIIVFEGEDPEYEYTSMSLPEGWDVYQTPEKIELVACLDRVSEEKIKTCPGYESDDLDEPFDLELYGATWEITLYEPATGEEVASGELEASDKECPFFVSYDEEEEVQREYSDVDDQVRGFVKEYVAP